MKEEHQRIAKDAFTGARKGALLAGAASIVSGVALTTTPVTAFFGFITIGSAVAVALPIVATVAAGGAIVGGTAAAISRHRRDEKIKRDFENHLKGERRN